jgi:Hemolysin-coregulated protein (uncharacterized)
MFMKVDGASGESKDASHSGWTDIDSFSWGATQPGTMASGGGGGAAKVSFNDLTVVAKVDRATPAILKNCSSGKHLGKVEISTCKAGGDQIEFSRITLTDVMVTAVQFSGTEDNQVLVNYSFQASQVRQQYWEQLESGGRGPEVQMGWDVKQNVEM